MPINKAVGRALESAREMARSGAYARYYAVEAEVRHLEGYAKARRWFKNPDFCRQLDRLCETARAATRAGRKNAEDRSDAGR